MLVFGFVALRALSEAARNEEHAEGSVRSEQRVAELLERMMDVESGERAYLLTGEERYLASLRGADTELPARILELRALGHSRPARAQIDSLEWLITSRLAAIRDNVRGRRLAPFATDALNEELEEGRQATRAVRQHVRALRSANIAEWELRERNESDRELIATAGLALGGLLAALLAALTTYLFSRHHRYQVAQQAYLRGVVDANPNPVFAKDLEGRFTLANQAFAAMRGTTPDRIVGRGDSEFVTDASALAAYRDADRRVIETGEPMLIAEEPVELSGGRGVRWLQTRKVRFLPPNGGTPQVLVTSVDITERRALEEQFRQSQKMEAIGRLAGGVAHDFNNLLTVIKGSSAMLLEDLGPDDPAREEMEQIVAAADRATALTRQLLAFSRARALNSQRVDASELLRRLSGMLIRLIGAGIELRTELDPGLPHVVADPGRLEQVVTNLVVNARDAIGEAGAIRISTRLVEHVAAGGEGALPAGRYVAIAVADTGGGIAPEIADRIFEPFFTTKEMDKGTGLGLSTVYGIVTQSGGTLRVESVPGEGTTFTVLLPAADDHA